MTMNLQRLAALCLVLVVTSLASAESKARKAGEATLGPASFDAEGADFKVWMTQFKDQLYDQWVPPQVIPEEKRLRLKVESDRRALGGGYPCAHD